MRVICPMKSCEMWDNTKIIIGYADKKSLPICILAYVLCVVLRKRKCNSFVLNICPFLHSSRREGKNTKGLRAAKLRALMPIFFFLAKEYKLASKFVISARRRIDTQLGWEITQPADGAGDGAVQLESMTLANL